MATWPNVPSDRARRLPPRRRTAATARRALFLEALEARQLLAIDLPGQTNWIEQGLSLVTLTGDSQGNVEGQNTLLGAHESNSAFIGAVQTLAIHPTDNKIVYAGSVNGGVWRTSNIDATAELAGVKVEVTVAGDNTRNEQQIVTVKETKILLNRLVPQLPRDGELAGVYRLADPATSNVVWAPM